MCVCVCVQAEQLPGKVEKIWRWRWKEESAPLPSAQDDDAFLGNLPISMFMYNVDVASNRVDVASNRVYM